MKKFAVIDAETDPFAYFCLPEPFLWGYYNGSEYKQFTRTEDLIEFIKYREEIIFAHNGGKFDFHFLFREIRRFDKVKVINGRLSVFHIGLAELRDSWIMLPVPLGAYQKDEIDYSKFHYDERYNPENWAEIEQYLKSDCVYLYDLIAQFHEKYGTALTMAGASLKQWEKISGQKAPKSNRSYYELLSPYYYGGRVECFKSGIINTNFEVVDLNSAYPYAMLYKHPISTDYEIVDEFPDDPDYANASLVEVDGVSYGAFPWRDGQGKLTFPHGERHTYYVTGWEYFAARETGTLGLHTIKSIRVFEQLTDFSDYINYFYNQRKAANEAGDTAEYLFCKLFMNSLYGKFAANPDKYGEFEVIPHQYLEAAELDGWELVGEVEGLAVVTRELEEDDKIFYNIATSASITGFVRAQLWRSICQCKGMIYCDTDSIAAENVSSLPMGRELGQWKSELTCDRAAVAGKKLYSFRSAETSDKLLSHNSRKPVENGRYKVACKGVRLTPSEIERVARGEEITYNPDVPTYSLGKSPMFVERKINKRA